MFTKESIQFVKNFLRILISLLEWFVIKMSNYLNHLLGKFILVKRTGNTNEIRKNKTNNVIEMFTN